MVALVFQGKHVSSILYCIVGCIPRCSLEVSSSPKLRGNDTDTTQRN